MRLRMRTIAERKAGEGPVRAPRAELVVALRDRKSGAVTWEQRSDPGRKDGRVS